MTTPSLRALSQRAGAGPFRNPVSRPSFSYGRTAAYRRIASSPRAYSEASLRHRQDVNSTPPPFALRSHFLPPSISSSSTGSVRYVSFKELREQRQREKAGQAAQQTQEQSKSQAQPEPEAKPEPEPQPSASSEADEIFAKAKAESEQEWENFKQAEEEQQQKAGKESAEGEEGKDQKKKARCSRRATSWCQNAVAGFYRDSKR